MLAKVLPRNSRARSIATCAVAVALAAIVVQFVVPGTPGGGRGTPAAILFVGFIDGCAVAITAVGLVLVYRTLRIINFAQAAFGAVGGRLFFELVQFTQVPFPIALILSIAAGALLGIAFDLTFGRRYFNAPRIVLTVVTIAALPFFAYTLANLMPSLPIFPRASSRSLCELAGCVPSRGFLPFAGWKFKIGGFNNTYGFPEVFNIELLVFAVVGLVCFLRYTRAGVAVRALAENSERASLLGIPVGNLSMTVWAIAGGLSTLSVIGIGSLTTPSASTASSAAIPALLAPICAAVLARFESLPVAITISLLLATVSRAVLYSYPDQGGAIQFAFFAIVAVALLIQRKRMTRSEEGAGSTWAALKETRAIPKELAKLATVRTTRWALIGVALAVVLLYPMVAPVRFQFLGSTILLQAIVGVSLVILTGWAGQISLGQFGFAAIGALVGGALTARLHFPFWIAVPIASATAGAVATIIGIPALRLKGLFLGVVTLAFGLAVDAALFDEKYFGWIIPKSAVDRPTLFFLNFDQERPMYYLALVCLIIAIVITRNLRKSRFGRLLIAMRENEANVQSFGVSAVRLKLTAFAVSGTMAGFAGAVFVHQQRGLSAESFSTTLSMNTFVFTVLGGIGSVGGALLGSLFGNLTEYFLPSNDFFATVLNSLRYGGLTLIVLFVVPGGLSSLLASVRDAWLRIIAQRRQIIVPSLFADYDPNALERRLIPLADPDSHSGLAALGPGANFRLGSEIHGGGPDGANKALAGREQERLAIGAAADRLGDVGAAAPTDVVGAAMLAMSSEDAS